MKSRHHYIVLTGAALLCLCTLAPVEARGGGHAKPRPSTQSVFYSSTEFYVTFPENLHQAGDPPSDLSCVITSAYATTGTVQLLGPGNTVQWEQSFALAANGVQQVMVPHTIDDSAEIRAGDNEHALRKALHITATMPIVVYGINHVTYTTDGFLAIPPSAWGTDYYVASYYGTSRTDEYPYERATSEFALVAAYDSTYVTVVLSDATMDSSGVMTHAKGSSVNLRLDRGAVYQMQAQKVAGEYNDLTGTHITSNKPVGVLAGTKCADVPVTRPACDYLLEMLPPTATWGTDYITSPFDPSRTAGDTWRVIPQAAGTTVAINGRIVGTTSPGDAAFPWFETTALENADLNAPAHWSFNKPALLCQYINSQDYDQSDHGDPSFAVLESTAEYATRAIFATLPDPNGFANYVNIVVQDSIAGTTGLHDSVSLDGYNIKQLPSPDYYIDHSAGVPNSTYWAYHVRIPGGAHVLSAPSGFSACAVGYKDYESYAWPCAMGLRVEGGSAVGGADALAPVTATQALSNCGEMRITLRDTAADPASPANLAGQGIDGTGIGWLYEHGIDSTFNYAPEITDNGQRVFAGDHGAVLHVRVANPAAPAHGALYVTDRAGNDTTLYLNFTPDTIASTSAQIIFDTLATGATATDSVVLVNPRPYRVTVDSVWFLRGREFIIDPRSPTPPYTIDPAGRFALHVQFTAPHRGAFEDTLVAAFACRTIVLAVARGQTAPPCVTVGDRDFGRNSPSDFVYPIDAKLPVANVGLDTLVISRIRIAGDDTLRFLVLDPPLPLAQPLRIAPGDSSTKITLRFLVMEPGGTFIDSLIVTSNSSCVAGDSVGLLTGTVLLDGVRDDALPRECVFRGIAPNPVNGNDANTVGVNFAVRTHVTVDIGVFNLLGERVLGAALAADAGEHTAPLNTAALRAGVYAVQLRAGAYTATKWLAVVR